MANKYGMLIDYKWCSGCKSCEVACKYQKNFDVSDPVYGITVLQVGPFDLGDGKFEWNYIPTPTSFCDMCQERIDEWGNRPPCEIACLGQCMTIGPVDELAKLLAEKGEKAYLFLS